MQTWGMQKGGDISGLQFYFQKSSVLFAISTFSLLPLEVQDLCGLGWCSINPTSGLQGSEHLMAEPFLW